MKKLIKKILILSFVVAGIFLASNNCFANEYDVNVMILGNVGVGKASIARRLCGKNFYVDYDSTDWDDEGVGNCCREYIIGRDTFNCYFFDTFGFLKVENPDITRQIDLAPISNMSLVLVVVDPMDSNHGEQYRNGIQEAFARHAISLREKNPKCGIVIVVNKSDLLDDAELEEVKNVIKVGEVMYEGVSVSSAIVSAKNNSAFESLEKIIKDFLVSHKNVFAHKENCFKYCAKCKKKFFPSGNCRGKYCSESCLRNAEGFLCSYNKCPSRVRNEKFLKNEPGVEEYRGSYYCSDRCLHDAVGTVCANSKSCPNMRPKLLPSEAVEGKKSSKLYCSEECRHKSEDCCIM